MATKASDCHEGERWPQGRGYRAVQEHEEHVLHTHAVQLQCWCKILACKWLSRGVRMSESRAKVVASAGDVCSEWLAHCPLKIFTYRCGTEEHLEKTLCSMMENELSSRSFAAL